MKIRPTTHTDDTISIWREIYRSDYVGLLPDGVDLPFEPRGECVVAEIDGAIAGFAYIDLDWLDELWVRKQFQCRGVGTALVNHAEAKMRKAGFTCGYLSVLRANIRAVALYNRLGWRTEKAFQDRRSGVWNLKMVKHFASSTTATAAHSTATKK
jgi:GNAT superfamily N-acetyltransferase